MPAIRQPAVSGLFYPADANQLAREVCAMLDAAPGSDITPKALIVPHAGYIYSGEIAAAAYATLKNPKPTNQSAHPMDSPLLQRGVGGDFPRIRRVVLLGPTHRVVVRGLALPDTEAFDTPLGRVMLDQEAMQSIAHLPQVVVSGAAHAQEHSLEVQLPFLQSVLDDFTLLPLAVGMANAEEVAEVLEAVWGGTETLIVISSDLSHYLPYAASQLVDGKTTKQILALHELHSHEEACGATPINGLILAARKHHLTPHLLDLRNSGDTAGSRDGVVGYAAFAFTAGDSHADQ